MKKRRQNTKTTLSLAPLTVDEALKTPPPKDEPKPAKRKSGRKKSR